MNRRQGRGRAGGMLKAVLGMLVLFGLSAVGVVVVADQFTTGEIFDGVFGPESTSGLFVDDDGSPFEAEIERIADAGVSTGCGDPEENTFCPGRPVTRGEMAAFLARVLDDLPEAEPGRFGDVPEQGPFAEPVARLAAADIVQGCGEDEFCPGAEVTRGQVAAFLARSLEFEGGLGQGQDDPFTDVPSDSPFADPIGRLAADGVISGCNEDGSQFCPDEPVTRAQLAVLLVRSGLVA